MRRKMEIQAKIDKLEQITALVDNPDAQAILESLKRDIHKLDDDTEVPVWLINVASLSNLLPFV